MSNEDLRVGRWTIPETELEERFDTSGGPGGQHANRSHTAVTLRLQVATCSLPPEAKQSVISKLGEVVDVTASDSRSQWRNRAAARKRLIEKLESALVMDTPRTPTKPSRSSKERRLRAKRSRSQVKESRRRPDPE